MTVSPPYPRLPSLNALRAFEAAARLGGFTQAAEELGVTPGAVTAQVKKLETELEAQLFERHARGVRLTPLGHLVLPQFIEAFDALGGAVRDLRRHATPRKVHIATSPALAQLWMAPRLPALRDRLPGVDLSLTAIEHPPNLKRVPFDLCLFYTNTPPRDHIRLCEEEILPVCAPALTASLRRPEDLREAICLSDALWEDWALWSVEAMPDVAFAPRGPVFSLYALAVEEALNGGGVLMARRALVARHLASGELVAPFTQTSHLPLTIALWMLPESRNSREVSAVAEALSGMA